MVLMEKNKKVVLVTGGAGFIGSHLCGALIKKGYSVVCFDNFSTGSEKNITHLKNDLVIVRGDVNDRLEVDAVFAKHQIDYVFHHAAVVGVQRTLEQPLSVLADAHGMWNLLEASKNAKVKKFVFASSSEVYGDPVEIPERENGHLNPHLPYAVTKLYGEKLLEAYYQTYHLPTCSLRFFNVYGPRQDSSPYGFVVGIFIKQALAGQAPTVFGDGTQTRDFVYVDDNVEATILAMESPATDGKVINVGTGIPTTILYLAEEVVRLCGKDGSLSPRLIPQPRKDVSHRFPNVQLMIETLKCRPKVRLDEGLKRTIEYYRNLKG